MKQIKLQKRFWDKIVSGEKKYEFRKLNKAIETNTYEFRELKDILPEGECRDEKAHQGFIHYISVDDEYIYPEDKGYFDYLLDHNMSVNTDWPIATKSHNELKYCRKCNWQNDVYETFGTAHLKPIAVNPNIIELDNQGQKGFATYEYTNNIYNPITREHKIGKETYDFAKEHYIDEGEGFVICEISNVKEGK